MKFYKEINLTFRGQLADEGQIPVLQLTIVLQALQKILCFIAMETLGLTFLSRLIIPKQIQENYQLIFSGISKCCLQTHVGFGNVNSFLLTPAEIDKTLEKFNLISRHVENSDCDSLESDIPDAGYRENIYFQLQQLMPESHSGYSLQLREKGADYCLFNSDKVQAKFLDLQYTKAKSTAEFQKKNGQVTGELIDINFMEQEITILDILSKSEVTAKYNPDAESKLLELRRMLLKLTGVVVYGHSEKPKKVLSATITSMSTDDYNLESVFTEGSKLMLKSPLDIEVSYDSDLEMLCAKNMDLNLDVCAASRVELEEEIQLEIASLWRTYSEEDDDNLTSGAQKLKRYLKKTIYEVSIDA